MQLTNLLSLGFLAATVTGQSISQALDQNDATRSISVKLASFYPESVTNPSNSKNFTILAPSDSAISSFLVSIGVDNLPPEIWSKLLSYHTLDGLYPTSAFNKTPIFPHTLLNDPFLTSLSDGQRVKIASGESNITITSGLLAHSHVLAQNINMTNGLIHIIDRVLTIPTSISETALATNLSSFASALATTNLTDNLDNRPNITIFAPSNTAFDAISSLASNLTEDELKNILSNHVVDGITYSSELKDEKLKNLNGSTLRVKEKNNTLRVQSAELEITDVLVENGVLHVIDSVILNVSSKDLPPLEGGAASSSMALHTGLQAASALMMAALFAL
ncbi:hypothetical protein K3495_g6111 [Podosphaera aphanis]|nr:hypothetical protein K3495_g6111 [Podosphaera aphanis]